ncbi:YbaN family protein [Aerococcus urinaeequi]|uniref:YbaN family protein n=1 Tax=Aerococcus urinaeequi TaxID=51665 RepID=UPI003D6AC175
MEMRTIKEKVFLILGLLSVVLGSVGVILPVLPTTPFLLLAGWFFTRSSPRFKNWLESTRLYERYVGEFKRQGGISRRKKNSYPNDNLSCDGFINVTYAIKRCTNFCRRLRFSFWLLSTI